MQNPLLGDEQFNPTASDGRFAPVDIIDLTFQALKRRTKGRMLPMTSVFKVKRRMIKGRIRIAEQPSALEELGKFSETLTKNLVDSTR